MRQDWLEEQEGESRRSPDDGVCDVNDEDDADEWGEAGGNGTHLGGRVYEVEHEGGRANGGMRLQRWNPCVRVGVQSMTGSGGAVLDPFPDSPEVVR